MVGGVDFGTLSGRAVVVRYRPTPESVEPYDRRYAEYLSLHDYFGRGANDVMHRLKGRRRETAATRGVEGRTAFEGDDQHERAAETAEITDGREAL